MTKSTPPTTAPEDVTEMKAKARPFRDLADTGLLWLINETVFWPRGFSLAIGYGEDDAPIAWSLLGNGSEPWQVSSEGVAAERFRAANAFFDSLRSKDGAA